MCEGDAPLHQNVLGCLLPGLRNRVGQETLNDIEIPEFGPHILVEFIDRQAARNTLVSPREELCMPRPVELPCHMEVRDCGDIGSANVRIHLDWLDAQALGLIGSKR